jgi:hypothetical protein
MLRSHRREAVDATSDRRVMSLLDAAAAPTEPGTLSGEVEALAAFRDAQGITRRPARTPYFATARMTLAAALTGLVLAGGVGAAAAAGSLPGAAQDTASKLLGRVGVSVPSADARSAHHADKRGGSADLADEKNREGEGATESIANSAVPGAQKGAVAPEYAPGGRGHAGERGRRSHDKNQEGHAGWHGHRGEDGDGGRHGHADEDSRSFEDGHAGRDERWKQRYAGDAEENASVGRPDDDGDLDDGDHEHGDHEDGDLDDGDHDGDHEDDDHDDGDLDDTLTTDGDSHKTDESGEGQSAR